MIYFLWQAIEISQNVVGSTMFFVPISFVSSVIYPHKYETFFRCFIDVVKKPWYFQPLYFNVRKILIFFFIEYHIWLKLKLEWYKKLGKIIVPKRFIYLYIYIYISTGTIFGLN